MKPSHSFPARPKGRSDVSPWPQSRPTGLPSHFLSHPNEPISSVYPPITVITPNVGTQMGDNVFDVTQLPFSQTANLGWYLNSIAKVIPRYYRPNRKFNSDRLHIVLDRASRFLHDVTRASRKPPMISQRPEFTTTCQQLASLIPTNYFPPHGTMLTRFLEGVRSYTREKAGFNPLSPGRISADHYTNSAQTVDPPLPVRFATTYSAQVAIPFIKQEDDIDSAVVPEIPRSRLEGAIKVESEDEDETLIPSMQEPRTPEEASSLTKRNRAGEAAEIENVGNAAETNTRNPTKKSKDSSKSKKRKRAKVAAESEDLDNTSETGARKTPKKAKREKKSRGSMQKDVEPKSKESSETSPVVPATTPKTSRKKRAATESISPPIRTKRKRQVSPQRQSSPLKEPSPDIESSDDEATPTPPNSAAASADSFSDEDSTPQPQNGRRFAQTIHIQKLMTEKKELKKKTFEDAAAIEELEARNTKLTQDVDKGDRLRAALRKENADLRSRNEMLENLFMKGARFTEEEMETTLVRVSTGINTPRGAFEMIHKCKGPRQTKAKTAK